MIAPGNLVVETNVKKVQHPTGGVVGELRVRDGTPVKAGDVVVRLDDTVTRANLAIVVKSLDELAARQARLEAERDAASAPSFPAELLARRSDPDVARLIAGEQKLFETRRSARQGQKAQLKERVGQLQEQISGPQRSDRGQAARNCPDRRGAEGRTRTLAEELGSDHPCYGAGTGRGSA